MAKKGPRARKVQLRGFIPGGTLIRVGDTAIRIRQAGERVEGLLRCVADPRGRLSHPADLLSRYPGYLIREGRFCRQLEGEGRGSEDSTRFQQQVPSCASVASDTGNLQVRYLAGDGDVYLLRSSLGGGSGPCPSTF